MIATQTKEFTLPFVGREEELQFLLDEYDQMLHAQYRSVWIEAPAGVGKTTLAEEFLKRITVGAQENLNLTGLQDLSGLNSPAPLPLLHPWIVHAHLRERSSNSLLSLVEALSTTLQTLTDAQREKLFSGLTSFYEERAKKVVAGAHVQRMEMEEAITTAGYILKQLSKYFPLVVIIEDIHVLKGEMSFYALRHLQAIVEHVPMMVIFISRPSEEKYLKQFQEMSMGEGCKKKALGGLREEDVRNLVEAPRWTSGRATDDSIKKLMHLSGGNALLIRELLRSDLTEVRDTSGSITEKIIRHLTSELERLPKRDRQVIMIAGMLGEEFSVQLLHEVTDSKNFRCWSDDVLQRFEQKGILRQRTKTLTPEGGGKGISLRVATFAHALWWEAARKISSEENKQTTWSKRQFAETIVPLLSHQDYPLLTDAELIVNLFRWLPRGKSLPLLMYMSGLTGLAARWHFHTEEGLEAIFAEAHRSIKELQQKLVNVKKEYLLMAVHILNTERVFVDGGAISRKMKNENYLLAKEIMCAYKRWEKEIVEKEAKRSFLEGLDHILKAKDHEVESVCRHLSTLEKKVPHHELETKHIIREMLVLLQGMECWYSRPEKVGKFLNRFLAGKSLEDIEDSFTAICIVRYFYLLPLSVKARVKFLSKVRPLIRRITKKEETGWNERGIFLAFIQNSLDAGLLPSLSEFRGKLDTMLQKAWSVIERHGIQSVRLLLLAFESERGEAGRVLGELFSEKFSKVNEALRFTWNAGALFYLEEWQHFDKLWDVHKNYLVDEEYTPSETPAVIPILETRALMCMATGDTKGVEEVKNMVFQFAKKYPVMEKRAGASLKKIEMFLSLKEKNISIAKKRFAKFLNEDEVHSIFDKAYLAQLFARIGVHCGHPPKEFSSSVKYSLHGFAKLNLPLRVVFTAEKFAEANLMSRNALQGIRKKYSVRQLRMHGLNDERPKNEIRTIHHTVESEMSGKEGQHITLYTLGRVRAEDSSGHEIVSLRWGMREHALSNHKKIILELTRARLEGKKLSRKELLSALYPEVGADRVSGKRFVKLDGMLSVFLSEIKRTFAPFKIFERSEKGYFLDPSVRIDIIESKKNIEKSKILLQMHLPSAVWLLQKSLDNFSRGKFAAGINTTAVDRVRKETDAVTVEARRLIDRLMTEIRL